MRIAVDMDGTITEGRYLSPPRLPEHYQALAPYDRDTIWTFNTLCEQHEVYIITARCEIRVDDDIQEWLYQHGSIYTPTAILSNPIKKQNNKENAVWKRQLIELLACDIVFDDSPYVYLECSSKVPTFLMDNPSWEANQLITDTNRLKSWREVGDVIARFNNRESYS